MFREYKIIKGKLKGTYKIYLHKDYWKIDYPNTILKEWTIDHNYTIGDWVQSMDGFIVQVLSVRLLKFKRHLQWVRFPMCTSQVYERVNGEYSFSNFYAIMTSFDRTKLGLGYNDNTIQKQEFVNHLLSGMTLIDAYNKVFSKYRITNKYSTERTILKLLKDKTVRDIMLEEAKSFQSELNKVISDERILEELDQLLSKSRKGSMAHLGNLKFVMELKGLYQPEQTKKKFIEDANYQEIIPPQLPV